jgi:hypothetical protein
MPKTRKSHPPSLKARVAMEAIEAHKTAAQIDRLRNWPASRPDRALVFARLCRDPDRARLEYNTNHGLEWG